MNNFKIDFTEVECKIMRELLKNENDGLIVSAYEHDKVFKGVIKYLIEMNIVFIHNDRIKVYHNKLVDLLDEQEIINYWYDYLNEEHFCHWLLIFGGLLLCQIIML
jgi:hypothetical protein